MSADLKRSYSASARAGNPPSAHDALPAGTRFGEFEIIRVISAGAFGIVYLAHDHSLERRVALKEYLPATLAKRSVEGRSLTLRSGRSVAEMDGGEMDGGEMSVAKMSVAKRFGAEMPVAESYAIGLRSFMNEARLLARFDHPSLVKVYRFWEENATAYRVMPFLQGITLGDARRAMTRAPDEAWIRSVIDPVLDALELLHRQGVSHRAIAPDNVMLPSEGPPILLDLGAARRVIGDRTPSQAAGPKPGYAAIEQYAEMGSMTQGPATDLYSLGAVVHYLLFNTPPQPAPTRASTDDAAAALAQRQVPGVSPRMIETVAWMLALRPEHRPPDVATVRAALNGEAGPPDVARNDGTDDADAGRIDAAPPPKWRWGDMRPSRDAIRRFAAGAALALLLGAGLLWQFVELLGAAHHTAAVAAASARSRAASAPGGVMAGTAPRSTARVAATVPAPVGATASLASAASVVPAAATVSASVGSGSGSLPGATADTGRRVASAGSGATAMPASAASGSARTRALKTARGDPGLVPLPADQLGAAVIDGRATAPTAEVASGAVESVPAPAMSEPASARGACGSRVFLALALCMERECEAPRYRDSPECVSVLQIKRNRESRYQ